MADQERGPDPNPDIGSPADDRTQRQRDYETGHSGDHDLDPAYLAWRRRQLETYDRDYKAWRERRAQSHDQDFRRWRADDPAGSFETWRGRKASGFGESPEDPSGGQSTTGAVGLSSIADRAAGIEPVMTARKANIVDRTDDMQDRE